MVTKLKKIEYLKYVDSLLIYESLVASATVLYKQSTLEETVNGQLTTHLKTHKLSDLALRERELPLQQPLLIPIVHQLPACSCWYMLLTFGLSPSYRTSKPSRSTHAIHAPSPHSCM